MEYILLNEKDSVGTAIADLKKGTKIGIKLDRINIVVNLREDIRFGHKFALRDIKKGEEILKYGLPIGNAMSDIFVGEWVHTHNCRSKHWGSFAKNIE